MAPAPAGLEPGSPFGHSIEAMAVYLHYAHAIGLERLRALMGEVFGLSISAGALCNILARARAPLGAAASAITAMMREARVVCEPRDLGAGGGQNLVEGRRRGSSPGRRCCT